MHHLLRVLLLLMLAGLQVRLWIADGGIAHTHRLQQEAEAQREDNERLRSQNAAMEAEIMDLRAGVAAIESRARTTLGMVREGETFFFVVDAS